MSPLLIKISKDFATLWTTIDPIGNVALFAGLTAALTRAERHRTALRAIIYATIILSSPRSDLRTTPLTMFGH
jgi:multiple antibiotic resistance protein